MDAIAVSYVVRQFLDYKPNEISLAVVVTLIGALLTRMTVFYLGVKSPMY
jgi:hypothetical protein